MLISQGASLGGVYRFYCNFHIYHKLKQNRRLNTGATMYNGMRVYVFASINSTDLNKEVWFLRKAYACSVVFHIVY